MTKAVRSMVVVCAVAGCGFPQRTRVVNAGDVGSPERSRIVQYMANSMGVQEQAPDGVSRAVIADEASIASAEASRICFDVLVRSAVDLDTPLGAASARVNGRVAYFEDERVAVRDYPYSGERAVVVLDAASPQQYLSMQVTEPADYAFRVVERSGRVCGAPAEGPEQVLALRASHAVVADTGEVFRWRLAE